VVSYSSTLVRVLRFGLFYGPDAGTDQLAQALRGRRIPAPSAREGLLPWVRTDDAAAATVAAIERGRPGEIYNVVDDEPTGMRQFLHAVAAAAGAPRPLTVPTWLLGLGAPYLAAVAGLRLPVSNAKALRDLGWKPEHPSVRTMGGADRGG
jgi:nucleoside-diphosphate-sugar epimerase